MHGYLQVDFSATLTINPLLLINNLLGSTIFFLYPPGLNSTAATGDLEQQLAGSVAAENSNQEVIVQPGSSTQNAEPVQRNVGYVNEGLED